MDHDHELIAAVAAGDDAALRELFARHAPWLAARLRAVLPAADVEDVLQETFLAIWQGAKNYRPEAAGAAWLWGIARRQAAQWLRRRGRAAELVAALAQVGAPAVPDPAEAALIRAELADAVEALGPPGAPEREVWRLVYLQDLPVAEVAELMGVPAGTVKSRAHRTRRLLRAAIGSAAEPQPPGPAPRQRCPGGEDRLPMPAQDSPARLRRDAPRGRQ